MSVESTFIIKKDSYLKDYLIEKRPECVIALKKQSVISLNVITSALEEIIHEEKLYDVDNCELILTDSKLRKALEVNALHSSELRDFVQRQLITVPPKKRLEFRSSTDTTSDLTECCTSTEAADRNGRPSIKVSLSGYHTLVINNNIRIPLTNLEELRPGQALSIVGHSLLIAKTIDGYYQIRRPPPNFQKSQLFKIEQPREVDAFLPVAEGGVVREAAPPPQTPLQREQSSPSHSTSATASHHMPRVAPSTRTNSHQQTGISEYDVRQYKITPAIKEVLEATFKANLKQEIFSYREIFVNIVKYILSIKEKLIDTSS